jgi:hypothetical protein
MTHIVYAVFPKLLMQINPVRHRPKMTAMPGATSGFLGWNYLHKLALYSGGTFDVLLIPYCRRPYRVLHLDLLSVFIWEHQSHIGDQCNPDVNFEPHIRNWSEVELVLPTKAVDCSSGYLLPVTPRVHQPYFLPH